MVAFVLRLLVVLLLLQVALSQTCRGLSNYKLEIQMQWHKENDRDFNPKINAVGGVISVVHTDRYTLFATGSNLTVELKHLMQNNKLGPVLKTLENEKTSRRRVVHDYDYITGAKAKDILKLNVKMNGDTGATYVSFLGVLLGTPDFFFGISKVNMCRAAEGQFIAGRQVYNFTKRFPVDPKQIRWVGAFDAGYDSRNKITSGSKLIPQFKGVDGDEREALDRTRRYATFKMTPGLYDGYFAFWKILVIVGVLATAALVAFICLYPVCCKKQMLDVPVPLQDESQWAT